MHEQPVPDDDAGAFWRIEPGWTLSRTGAGGYLPFNQLTSRRMLICDDDVLERVVAAMRQDGCPVVDRPSPRQHDR
ncbi:hypothetical protein [Dactylosporangium sp. NPDC051541]|uniref:hypothetical protein n=1 Tax=Dactylosporangium sp. NPDC051541 TaxID=3363977 RepID=UPI00378E3376